MRKTWLLLLALTTAVAVPAVAGTAGQGRAASPEGSMHGMGGGMMEMMHGGMGNGGHHGMMGHGDASDRPLVSLILQNRQELQLTPEQVQKLETLRLDFQKASIKRSADLQVAELELEQVRKKEPVNLAKVEAQVRRTETLRAEQRLSRIKAIEEGKALLSPEQRQKLDTLGQSRARHGMTGCPMMMGGWEGKDEGAGDILGPPRANAGWPARS
jgi:Spy/CpxP family protein refolding chaperone